MLVAEEMHVWHASCSSRMATPRSESRYRHWPAQLEPLSMCVRTLNTRFGHGDDFVVAGDGDDLDWLSQKLNEKLELVQKARLGPGYDGEATVLNRCVTYSDSGLTWEADPRHAELAVAELGPQAARPHTSPGGAKPSAPLDQEELESHGQQAYHSVSARLAYLASDRSDIAFACKECSRAVLKATRADLTRLKRIGRFLLHTPRAVWEFPLQQKESIVLIDGLSDAHAAGCPKTRRSTSGECLRVGPHTLATWSSTQKVVRSDWPTRHESLDTKLKCESGQMLQQRANWLSEVGAAQSSIWRRSTFGCSRKRRTRSSRSRRSEAQSIPQTC